MNGSAFEGKKTYIGLVVALVGVILKEYMSEEEFQRLVSSFLEIFGIVMAAYGRYQAKMPLSPEAVVASSVTSRNLQ
jgi:hypothetical protein